MYFLLIAVVDPPAFMAGWHKDLERHLDDSPGIHAAADPGRRHLQRVK